MCLVRVGHAMPSCLAVAAWNAIRPVGTSRFSGLGLSLLNVALEPLGQKDNNDDHGYTEMMTWICGAA